MNKKQEVLNAARDLFVRLDDETNYPSSFPGSSLEVRTQMSSASSDMFNKLKGLVGELSGESRQESQETTPVGPPDYVKSITSSESPAQYGGHVSDLKNYLEFEVIETPDRGFVEYPTYEASTPYRKIVYLGKSRNEAIGYMIYDLASLARKGFFNPDHPFDSGASPVQHAMEVLTEALNSELRSRGQHIDYYNSKDLAPEDEQWPNTKEDASRMTKHNEVISGLSTAIAALARIKTL